MTLNKQKTITTIQVIVTIYLLSNMLISNLNGFDPLSTVTGLLGLFGNILLTRKKETTFALNMSNNVVAFFLAFNNRFFAEVLMNVWYFGTQLLMGIPYFKNNRDKDGNVKTDNRIEYGKLIFGVIFGTVFMGLFSHFMNGNMVVLDSVQNGIAITAQFRQMHGKADGWLLWIISNAINMVVWASVGNWIMVASFGAYIAIAITGYWNWSE